MRILRQMYPWTRKTPLNFGHHPAQESVSGLRIRIRDLDHIRLGGGMRSQSALVYSELQHNNIAGRRVCVCVCSEFIVRAPRRSDFCRSVSVVWRSSCLSSRRPRTGLQTSSESTVSAPQTRRRCVAATTSAARLSTIFLCS